MTIRLLPDGTIELAGHCIIDDAEKLHQHLMDDPKAAVDWRQCVDVHTAIIQILLVARPAIKGPPTSDFLKSHIAPLFESRQV